MAKPIKQQDADQLETGYSIWHRTYEIGGILVAVSLNTVMAIRLFKCPSLSGWWSRPAHRSRIMLWPGGLPAGAI